jgi:hypothetical protein
MPAAMATKKLIINAWKIFQKTLDGNIAEMNPPKPSCEDVIQESKLVRLHFRQLLKMKKKLIFICWYLLLSIIATIGQILVWISDVDLLLRIMVSILFTLMIGHLVAAEIKNIRWK